MLTSFDIALLSFVQNNVTGLYLIMLTTDTCSAFVDFLSSVFAKIFGIRVMVAIGSSVEQLLSGFLRTVSQVDIFGIIELGKNSVITAFLRIQNMLRSMSRSELSHDIRIIDVCFWYIEISAVFLGR